jgi:hypothetical protein
VEVFHLLHRSKNKDVLIVKDEAAKPKENIYQRKRHEAKTTVSVLI